MAASDGGRKNGRGRGLRNFYMVANVVRNSRSTIKTFSADQFRMSLHMKNKKLEESMVNNGSLIGVTIEGYKILGGGNGDVVTLRITVHHKDRDTTHYVDSAV